MLVVEDDPADAFAVERVLAGSVYQPLLARSIREAEHALADSSSPTSILLDVMLAADESWRLLLQRAPERSAARTFRLSVISSAGEDRKALHLGADEYLSKPSTAIICWTCWIG